MECVVLLSVPTDSICVFQFVYGLWVPSGSHVGTLFVKTEVSMEKGSPFDFERPYNDLGLFLGLSAFLESMRKVKNDEHEWVCEFTS